jgi:hypothetical protein
VSIGKQAFHPLQEVDRRARVAAIQRPPAGRLEALGRSARHRAGALVHRPELGAIPVRLLEMIARDLVQLLEVAPVLDEPVREPRMQGSALGLRQ